MNWLGYEDRIRRGFCRQGHRHWFTRSFVRCELESDARRQLSDRNFSIPGPSSGKIIRCNLCGGMIDESYTSQHRNKCQPQTRACVLCGNVNGHASHCAKEGRP